MLSWSRRQISNRWFMPGGILVTLMTGPLLIFGPIVLRGEALYWGTPSLQFIPWRDFGFELLRGGELPLWNPLLGMGAPLLANYQSAFFYLPNLILLITGAAWGQALLVLLHLVWAALGMLLLLRSLGLSKTAQVIGGLAFSLCGYLVARASFLSINAASAWLPWCILAIERLQLSTNRGEAISRGVRSALLLSTAFAFLLLTGHAQTSWYILVMGLIWGGFRIYENWGELDAGRFLILAALAGILAIGIAAVQLVPTIEYFLNSNRAADLSTEFVFTYSFWPWRVLTAFAPDLFGSPVSGDYWGYANYWEDAVYVGVLPLLLALLAGFSVRDKTWPFRRLAITLMIVAFSSLMLALGNNTPIFPWLFRWIPSFDFFQAPTRWTILLVFSFSILAGLGFDRWFPLSPRGMYWVRLGTAGAATIGLTAALSLVFLPEIELTFPGAFARLSVILVAVGVLALTRSSPMSTRWRVAVVGLVLIDLTISGRGLNPSISATAFEGQSELVDRVDRSGRLYMPPELEQALKFNTYFRFDRFEGNQPIENMRATGLPNVTMLDGLRSSNNFDPIRPDRYVKWLQTMEAQPEFVRERMLSMMAVAWEAQVEGEHFLEYVRREQFARVRLVPEAVWVESPEAALRNVVRAEFNPERQVILEGSPPMGVSSGGPGEVRSIEETPNGAVELNIEAPQGAWLVLADMYYPGWVASLEGDSVPVYPANFTFRGVWIPPGQHVVRFHYQPLFMTAGMAVSAAALLTMILLGIFTWRTPPALPGQRS